MISMATSETWKDKQTGEQREATEWHRVVFRNKLAEVVANYVKKGGMVYIEGSLKTRKYEKNGVDCYATEVHAYTMQMLGSRKDGEAQNNHPQSNQAQPQAQPQNLNSFDDDDVPF